MHADRFQHDRIQHGTCTGTAYRAMAACAAGPRTGGADTKRQERCGKKGGAGGLKTKEVALGVQLGHLQQHAPFAAAQVHMQGQARVPIHLPLAFSDQPPAGAVQRLP